MWTTRSGDSWQSVEWKPGHLITVDGLLIAFTEVSVTALHWDPVELAKGDEYSMTTHYHFTLPCVEILVSRVKELVGMLRRPTGTYHIGGLCLSPHDYQALTISLGKRDDVICSIDQPALTLRYDATRLRSEWIIPMDAPSIQEWAEQMELWLSTLP